MQKWEYARILGLRGIDKKGFKFSYDVMVPIGSKRERVEGRGFYNLFDRLEKEGWELISIVPESFYPEPTIGRDPSDLFKQKIKLGIDYDRFTSNLSFYFKRPIEGK